MERTSLYLVQSLPGISRWFEVEKREVVRIRACSHVLSHHSCSTWESNHVDIASALDLKSLETLTVS